MVVVRSGRLDGRHAWMQAVPLASVTRTSDATRRPGGWHIGSGSARAPPPSPDATGAARTAAGGADASQAPLPGRVVRIAVAVGRRGRRAPAARRRRGDEDRDLGGGAARRRRRGDPLRRRRGRRRRSGAGRVSAMMSPRSHERPRPASSGGTPTTRSMRSTGPASTSTTSSRPAGPPAPRSRAPTARRSPSAAPAPSIRICCWSSTTPTRSKSGGSGSRATGRPVRT